MSDVFEVREGVEKGYKLDSKIRRGACRQEAIEPNRKEYSMPSGITVKH